MNHGDPEACLDPRLPHDEDGFEDPGDCSTGTGDGSGHAGGYQVLPVGFAAKPTLS